MDRSDRERAALREKGIEPMALDNADAHCDGYPIRHGTARAGICYGCARYGQQARTSIQPAAFMDAHGVWGCPNRRSVGHVHTVGDGSTPVHAAG